MNSRVASLRQQLASSEHLDFASELVPYVDGVLDADAKRAAESHLANCATCRAEVGDLRGFVVKQRRWRPALIAALAAAAAIVIGFIVIPRGGQAPTPVRTGEAPVLHWTLRDGSSVIGVDRGGALRGITLAPEIAKRAASLLAHPDLAPPSSLIAAVPRSLRGAATKTTKLKAVSPNGIAVVGTRPQFIFHAPWSSNVEITISDGTNDWTAPADLPRGRTYTWQVATTIDGRRVVAPAPPDPPARFRVVDQQTADAIASARSHLVRGMLAYEAGAIADARREFEQLAAENPSSPIPLKLIASCDRSTRVIAGERAHDGVGTAD